MMRPFFTILLLASIFVQSSSSNHPLKEGEFENIYHVFIPFNFNNKEYKIELTCEKSENNTVNITKVSSDFSSIPNNFYNLILEDFSIKNKLMEPNNFEKSFVYYKNKGFVERELVSYKKEYFKEFSENLIYIVDINKDGFDDILVQDSQNSMNDASFYKLYLGTKAGICEKNDFFKNRAFFGWDKIGKYIITGISNTRERNLIKNKISKTNLIPIGKCTENAISDKYCW